MTVELLCPSGSNLKRGSRYAEPDFAAFKRVVASVGRILCVSATVYTAAESIIQIC